MNKQKSKLVVFSGAGLSAESGLDTFRDNNGLWAQYDPDIVCNYNNWQKNFHLVHHFYNLRREELGRVTPNAMHIYLAQLERDLKEKVQIIHLTQNVDDLLERAGASHIIHLHGELRKLICPQCGRVWDIAYEVFMKTPCDHCGCKIIKPYVVFFYEQAPQYACMYEILGDLTERDCVLVIGTSGNVIGISSLLESLEKSRNKKLGFKILNNLEPVSSLRDDIFDEVIYKPATQSIQEIHVLLQRLFVL